MLAAAAAAQVRARRGMASELIRETAMTATYLLLARDVGAITSAGRLTYRVG